MFGRLVGKVLDIAGRGKEARPAPSRTPVTDSVPEGWNDPSRRAAPAKSTVGGSSTCSIRFENLDKTVAVRHGTSILDAAVNAGIDLNHYCGGMASCGSCRVTVTDGSVSPLDVMEEATLDVVKEHDRDRLGCQTRILGSVTVTIPPQD